MMTSLILVGFLLQAPPPPTGVSASTPQVANITITWADSPPLVFNIYRASVSQGTYVKVNGDPVSGTYFPDETVTSGTRYFYVVRAVNSVPLESGNSSEVTAVATGTDVTAPQAPSITSSSRKTRDSTPSTSGAAEPGTTVFLFSGATEIGNTSVAMDGTWSIANPNSLGTDGVYQLTARARDMALNESPNSTAIQITLDMTPPPVPTNLRTTAYYACVDVEWNASSAVDLAGYKIQRKTGAGSWTTLNSNLVLGTKYRDATASNGVTYQYRVIAVDDALDY